MNILTRFGFPPYINYPLLLPRCRRDLIIDQVQVHPIEIEITTTITEIKIVMDVAITEIKIVIKIVMDVAITEIKIVIKIVTDVAITEITIVLTLTVIAIVEIADQMMIETGIRTMDIDRGNKVMFRIQIHQQTLNSLHLVGKGPNLI